MPSVGKIMRKWYGEVVLVVPGVASKQVSSLGSRVNGCLEDIARATKRSNKQTTTPLGIAGLTAALAEASGSNQEVPQDIRDGEEANLALDVIRRSRKEAFTSARGIKPRMSAAACCAIRYYRQGGERPIRIIGHSRGGAAAVGCHNIITSYGVPCNYTLTLDPCHGVRNGLVDYYHKTWAGNLENIPAAKAVGVNSARWLFTSVVERPAITAGAGATGTITNHPAITNMQHGHMGKLTRFKGSDAEKSEQRKAYAQKVMAWLMKPQPAKPAAEVLVDFFREFANTAGTDGAERELINQRVVHALTGGGTVGTEPINLLGDAAEAPALPPEMADAVLEEPSLTEEEMGVDG